MRADGLPIMYVDACILRAQNVGTKVREFDYERVTTLCLTQNIFCKATEQFCMPASTFG